MARFVLLTLAISSLVAVSASPIDGVLTLAPLYTPGPALASAEADAHLIPNSYMVILEDHLAPHEIDAHHAQLAGVHGAEQRIRSFKRSSGAHQDLDDAFAGLAHQFHIGRPGHGKRALKGYSGHFSDATIEAVRAMAGVKYVERDSLVQASEVELGAPWVRTPSPRNGADLVTRDSPASRTASRSRSARSTATTTRAAAARESTST